MNEFYNPITLKTQNIKVLITGATGYIGGRLIPRLLANNIKVRILVRDKTKIDGKSWFSKVEIFEGDLTKLESLSGLCDGIDQAFYLVHSMSNSKEYIELDRLSARNFVKVAKNNTSHVIYLGGISPKEKNISEHLSSRIEVGKILSKSLPTTELRAGPIIGSGSASFEMLRHLSEKLPIMVAPKWINNIVRPISVRDVLKYLVLSLDKKPCLKIDIGSDPMSFKDLMLKYCDYRGLKRYIFPVPVLAPGLAARWIGLVTPITNSLASPIVKSVINNIEGDISLALSHYPEIKTLNYTDSIKSAFDKTKKEFIETSWNRQKIKFDYRLSQQRGRFEEIRIAKTDATCEQIFSIFKSLGGANGWKAWNSMWNIRKYIDILLGGKICSEPDRENLKIGSDFDCFKIEKLDLNKKILLKMTLKTPGEAWLKFEAIDDVTHSYIVMTAIFEPKGIWGYLYWYSILPLHKLIFKDLMISLKKECDMINKTSVKI